MSLPSAHQFEFQSIDGEALSLSNYKGKALLVVNTASQCGFTPQYKELQALYDRYKEKGLVVLGVPSADFGGQEYATEEEVEHFTEEKFAVTFPLTVISEVKGGNAHPFYQWAGQQAGFIGSPKWNFHKYLIGKNGEFVTWFSSVTSPTSDKVVKAIEAELAK